jgi:hypothetical protein
MKIYTSALMPFEANDSFFARDSGLLCRTLRALGVESRVILPARDVRNEEDPEEIIRASANEFADPTWWKSLGIDAVVFISWGFKQHTPIIRAAREAGIRTCAIMETAGNPYPYGDVWSTIKMFWRKGKYAEDLPKRFFGTVARSLYFSGKGLTANYHRSVQIGIPHLAAFDTPSGMARCLKVARLFPWIVRQSEPVLLGYPIPDYFTPRPLNERRANVVAIARWDALRHKRPHVLMRMIEQVLPVHPGATFEIFGRLIPEMEQWHAGLPDALRGRVLLRGIQSSTVISESIGTSRILYCPSAQDGIPLAVAEGLCGGCSVAGLETPDVAALYWAGCEGDGSLARDDSEKSHAQAVISELEAWESGRRNPTEISAKWKSWFSAREVAKRAILLLGGTTQIPLH